MKNIPKKRAIELFSPNSPFKPKVVPNKKTYSRKRRSKDDSRGS